MRSLVSRIGIVVAAAVAGALVTASASAQTAVGAGTPINIGWQVIGGIGATIAGVLVWIEVRVEKHVTTHLGMHEARETARMQANHDSVVQQIGFLRRELKWLRSGHEEIDSEP